MGNDLSRFGAGVVACVAGVVLTAKSLALEPQKAPEKELALHKPTDYDCIILMTSLADFAKKKRIFLLRSISSDFDPQECHDVRIISVVGLFNKGKTFVLNKLFGLRLPSGKTQVTQGLSFVYLKERRMLLIDSPGVQSTVSYRSDSIDRVVDAQTTEAFLFELVSQLSDHIMFVVNDFTSFEQKTIQTFERKEQSRSRDKPVRELVVVHNLASTQAPAEAEQLFEKQITSRYDGVESHLGKLFYTARSSPPVHHFAICKEGSPAGEIFNHDNVRLLLEHLEHAKKLPERVVLQDVIRDKLDDQLPRFFLMGSGVADAQDQETREAGNQRTRDQTDAGAGKLKYGPLAELEQDEEFPNYQRIGSFHVTCEMDVKTEGVISELGEVISYDKSFSPEPMIYDEQSQEYRKRTIQFDCPGVHEDDVAWDHTGEGLTITIEKNKLIDEGKVTAVSGLLQQSGVYKKTFRFPDGPFDVAEDECKLDHGVLKIVLKKCLINKRGGLQSIQSRVEAFHVPTSSVPSEAEGLRHAPAPSDADAHPSTQASLAGKTSEGFQKIESTPNHCLTGANHQSTQVEPSVVPTD